MAAYFIVSLLGISVDLLLATSSFHVPTKGLAAVAAGKSLSCRMEVIMSQYKENLLIFPPFISAMTTSRYENHFPVAGDPGEAAGDPLEIHSMQ